MKIELSKYCAFSTSSLHERGNCRQCELLEKFFLRFRAVALSATTLYRGEALKRTEKEVSDDIARAIGEVRLS